MGSSMQAYAACTVNATVKNFVVSIEPNTKGTVDEILINADDYVESSSPLRVVDENDGDSNVFCLPKLGCLPIPVELLSSCPSLEHKAPLDISGSRNRNTES